MDVKKQIKSLLNQADIYKAQGLLRDAKEKYVQAGRLIQKNQNIISNYKTLMSAISKKVKRLNTEILRLENEPVSRKMSAQVQNVIREKFAFSKDESKVELDGAIALAKFGQYERAIREFKALLLRENIRLEAAKNILRCYIASDLPDDSVKQYQQWFSGDFFTPEQLETLRVLLQNILDKRGIDVTLPTAADPKTYDVSQEAEGDASGPEIGDDEVLDISSVGILLTQGSDGGGKNYEYDVSFQSGNVINLLIPSTDKSFMDALEPEMVLEQVQFYSPIAMFDGKAVVVSKSEIESGPKEGNYSLDIRIKSL
ncbi:hypothetical protein DENIS_1587 [Desulfonema ishimotonii]|uniref:Uncharacterized protein n=1 Tax=Desulfonema ishimotonii TaxID=45657 RepID=A0A401FUJ9_9BACT|nr:hypothetical protein [Desulfonema ishimotonii]GBC60630.1 hypothetical protein DENIS_1587 [Desulfonema ishimotonii]